MKHKYVHTTASVICHCLAQKPKRIKQLTPKKEGFSFLFQKVCNEDPTFQSTESKQLMFAIAMKVATIPLCFKETKKVVCACLGNDRHL